MSLHLSGDQIDELLQAATGNTSDQTTQEERLRNARRHLEDCAICQTRLRAHERAIESLALLKPTATGTRGAICPPDDAWLEIAAGISNPDLESHLSHAAQCDFCGPLLSAAFADFSDETTPEEARFLNSLGTASVDGQSRLAERLQRAVWKRPNTSQTGVLRVLRRLTPVWSFAAGIAIATVGFWGITSYVRTPTPQRLLVQAYSEDRTVEMRINGAPYAPLLIEKGAGEQSKRRRPALSKARSEIDKNLQVHPNDVAWLQADGRADLLDGQAEAAVRSLNRAASIEPNNKSVLIDLASAYFELNTTADVVRAANILSKLVLSNPDDEVVLFNYALALQGAGLSGQAAAEWNDYLRKYPTSEWAEEARSHLATIPGRARSESTAGQGRSQQTLVGFRGTESRPEESLETAVHVWLPNVYATHGDHTSAVAMEKQALVALARIMVVQHRDPWLQDILKSNTSANFRFGIKRIGQARDLIDTSDNDHAVTAAEEATSLFDRTHSNPGRLYAQFEVAYADQLSHRNGDCARVAQGLLRDPGLGAYPWLHIQAEIESAICASLADQEAFSHLHTALQLAADHHYPVLASRANQILASIYWLNGDIREAWETTAKGLQDFWSSDLPPLRGYNLLTNLDYLAEDQQLWGLKAAILREEIPLISGDPDFALQGFERIRLGETLFMLGELCEAQDSFDEAQRLFRLVPSGTRLRSLTAEANIGLAEIDLRRGMPAKAVDRLNGTRDTITGLADDDLALEFFKTYGLALYSRGDLKSAANSMSAAIALAQKGLWMVQDERDRLRWSRRNEPLFRAIVELKLRTAPADALGYWEYYRGASLLRVGEKVKSDQVDPLFLLSPLIARLGTRNEVLVSYFSSSRGVDVWIGDQSGLTERFIPVNQPDFRDLVTRFSEECSNPRSDLTLLRHDGLRLYRQIFLPIVPLLIKHQKVVLEPDGDLALIPFSALTDESGGYLGDRYDITISPGLRYLETSHPPVMLSRRSRALVVGDPAAPGWTSLPDAEFEARSIATQFEGARLLTRDEATYDHIAEAIRNADIFHFSGHGEVTRTSAGVIVGGANLLNAFGLDRLDLSHLQLVVLSACISAHGSEGSFNDEDSLPRFLLASGVQEVVASRWMVDSVATGALMNSFYDLLLNGKTAQESLDGAARAMRSQAHFCHPYYWAGFTTFGNT